MKRFSLLTLTLLLSTISLFPSNDNSKKTSYVHIKDGVLLNQNQPYRYIGANLWYGAILGSEGVGGNRQRLNEELDFLSSIGVDNLRVLVGSDGKCGVTAKVEPTLQIAPGVYNDTILAGLDYLLVEMGKRNMKAVLYLNNSWEWSGGYGQYLEWTGHGNAVIPAVDGWDAYNKYVSQFVRSDEAKQLFANYVRDILSRTNRYTNIKYINDPTIMSWQIGNEPRAFSEDNKEHFSAWIAEVAALIKSLDSNHLVSTGSEGKHGSESDIKLYETIHADPNIDYMNIHIWPHNWQWAHPDSLLQNLPAVKQKTKAYIDEHLEVAKKYNKPLVLEEFGYPRDGMNFSKQSTTIAKDQYLNFIFNQIVAPEEGTELLVGCNFWAWGGNATLSENSHIWQPGDDYTGDPAQEPQGYYSVFSTDSTVALIQEAASTLKTRNDN